MSRQRYSGEFKIEAVKRVTEKGKPVVDVAPGPGHVRAQPLLLDQGFGRPVFSVSDP